MLIGIITFTILVSSIVVYVIMPRGKPLKFAVKELEILSEILKDGDIICRLGDRVWSQFFKNISESDNRFSHMGIIRINNDLTTVIHAEGDTGHGKDFVHETALNDFVKIARAIGIYRINNVNGNQVSNIAAEYLGIPFDWQFDMQDESKLYCTELLYAILIRIAPELELNTIYINELGKNIIPLEAISNSKYFSEIYYVSNKE